CVDEISRPLHAREGFGIDELFGFRAQGAGKDHEIGPGKQPLQVRDSVNRVGRFASGRGIALDSDHSQPERLREVRKPAADVAQAHDEERLAADLVLALGDVGDHAAPRMLRLVIARFGELARHREDEGHRVLGDGAGIHAASAREPDRALAELRAIVLVGSRADGLDESQPRRALEEMVAPESRHDHDVGLGDAPLELVERADFQAVDAGISGEESLPQPVVRVSEENREAFPGGTHYPALRGGYFSPASIFVLRTFCFGGSGQVVNALNAQGGLYARFKSRSNVRFATGFGSMARKRPEPYVVLPAVSSLRIVKRPSSSSPTTSSLYVLPLSLNSM